MNRNAERSQNAILNRTAVFRGVVARATERERQRIARDLHDTLFQGFLGASLQLHYAVEQVPMDSPSRPSLSRALSLIQRVIDEGRAALSGLRSATATPTSLEQSLSGLREEFTFSRGVRFQVFVKGQPKTLSPELQEQIYLIGREALMNALRHSSATRIEAEIEYLPRGLRVVVRDNGCGIDQQVVRTGREGRWGLMGMRERARSIGGELRIWSRPRAGTEVEISVPQSAAAAAYA